MKSGTLDNLFILGVLLGMVACSVAQAETGLVGYWPFDEGKGSITHDHSGMNNEGRLSGATWVPGNIGTAINFNGKKSWVIIPKSNSLVPSNNQISILMWMCPGKPTGAIQHLVAKWDNYYLRLSLQNEIAFGLFQEKGSECRVESSFKFQPGRWYYVAAVYDGTTALIYVNDELVSSETMDLKLSNSNTYDLHIGSASWGTAELFNGRLDEVRIYNRALSKDEIIKIGGKELTARRVLDSINTAEECLLKAKTFLDFHPIRFGTLF